MGGLVRLRHLPAEDVAKIRSVATDERTPPEIRRTAQTLLRLNLSLNGKLFQTEGPDEDACGRLA
jgi:hypothetical protein